MTDRDPDSRRPAGRLRHSWLARALLAISVLGASAWVGSAATPSLLLVMSPSPGDVIGLEGVDVMVRFPRDRSVDLETFRVRLNGADVTEYFTTGRNGAAGQLFETLDGDNTLEIEVRGDRGGLPGRQLGDSREIRFLVRRPIHLDRG